MVDLGQQIEAAFGSAELPHGMFYAFEAALRFELGGEDAGAERPVRRFIQAFERADAVAANLFAGSPVWLLSSVYGGATAAEKHLEPYKTIGLVRSDFHDLGAVAQNDAEHIAEFGEDLHRYRAAAILEGADLVREVLWLTLGSELGIRPTTQASIHLVDLENRIALHPYDDRGMDVVAMDKEALLGVYNARHAWLSQTDVARMEAMFAP